MWPTNGAYAKYLSGEDSSASASPALSSVSDASSAVGVATASSSHGSTFDEGVDGAGASGERPARRVATAVSFASVDAADAASGIKAPRPPTLPSFMAMSPAGTYLDFSRGGVVGCGTWVHVVRGLQTFVLVPPSNHDTAAYELWLSMGNASHEFFGDLASATFRMDVHEGQVRHVEH